MKTRSFISTLFIMFVAIQAAWAQNVVLNYLNGESFKVNVSELKSVAFEENDETADNNEVTVIVNEDGVTPQGTIFTALDNNTFFVNYIKYTVKEGHLAVSGYDKIGLESINGAAKIVSMINYKGIPYQVLEIRENAFSGCTGLTSVTISNMVRSIGYDAFRSCVNMTSVTIGKCVTSIGSYAFYNCTSLTSITIPNSVPSIGEHLFEGCTGLTSVTIPNSVTSINLYAFYGCSSLTSITVESGNPKFDSRDNCNAIIETATNTLILGCKTLPSPAVCPRSAVVLFSVEQV